MKDMELEKLFSLSLSLYIYIYKVVKYIYICTGFEGEVMFKYSRHMYDCFTELFCHLPLAATLNNKARSPYIYIYIYIYI